MGRKSQYETKVQPYLSDIQEWYGDLDEYQIATVKLGVPIRSWERYKNEHPELREAIRKGKQGLVAELSMTLKFQRLSSFVATLKYEVENKTIIFCSNAYF